MTKEEIKTKVQTACASAKKNADNAENFVGVLITMYGINQDILNYIIDKTIVQTLTAVIDMLEKEEVVSE